jgi:hypothetical protein
METTMILIFGSLVKNGKEFVFINPLHIADMARIELSGHGHEVSLMVDGKEIRPSVVYMSRLWRTDCILEIPEECSYPTLIRHKVHSFLNEIRFAFDHIRWLPGKLEDIERGEAKIQLMRLADMCGLLTPTASTVSFSDLSREMKYRKSLGPPFTITFDATEGVENAVTLFNKESDKGDDLLGLPWQWQTHVEAVAQVRCAMIGSHIRAYRADIKQFQGKELREAHDAGLEIRWLHYKLPSSIEFALLRLCNKLKLTMCCPEFLITAEEKHIFIDLNPCGDWYGFVDEDESRKVAELIVETL